MPSFLHEAAASWLVWQYGEWRTAGLISGVAARTMTTPPSPRITNFIGEYIDSVKEPDFAFVPLLPNRSRRDFPSVVLESGWASTLPEFVCDRRLWHQGSGGRVMVVILVKLYRENLQNQVRATLQISHTTPGADVTINRMNLFPIPNPLPADPTVTIHELFGGQCPEGHDPHTVLQLDVGALREAIETNLISDGYLAA
ncbi:hypothetical protein HOY82DRAFT_628693 [Tuber indicum]|nr:hypothetical protein HOY82DRAFT_628693 [Tuber indicum]